MFRQVIQFWHPRIFKPAVIGYGLIGLCTGVATLATTLDLPLVQWFDQHINTLFFQLRGPVEPPPSIVILAMDDYTATQVLFYRDDPQPPEFVRWLENSPWPRKAHAVALERLFAAGARGVAVDVLFSDASSYGATDDRHLQTVLQQHLGRVALAAEYIEDNTQGFRLNLSSLPSSLQTTLPTPTGYINVLQAADGRIHHLPGQYRQQVLEPLQIRTVPAFSEAALQVAQLPRPRTQGELIYFYGPPGQSFETVSFWDILDPVGWQRLQAQQVFKDKLVLIGATAESFQDFAPTPFSELPLYPARMPGVEIHAHAIATLMTGKAIAVALPNLNHRGWFVLILVGSVAWLSRLPNTLWRRLLLSSGIALLWFGIGYVSFTDAQLSLPVLIPCSAIALNGMVYFLVGSIAEQLQRLRLHRTLERYVSPAVVQEILQQPEDYKALLKGRKVKAAVLFSDIRGFSSISETMASENASEQLVQQLNVYLDAMVKAILSQNGTVDKFIGDSIMAEFGSPVSAGEKQDALNAVRAALHMRHALIALRQQWQQEGRVLLFNGIGINYGELIAGNIGSEQRLEYTVIGVTVNIASRVEDITKDWGTDILITGNVYELVQDEVEANYLGEHQIKGIGEAIALYALIGLKGEDPQSYLRVRDELRRYINWKLPTL